MSVKSMNGGFHRIHAEREGGDATRGAFTLVELLAVIAIVAVLMSLLIPAISNAQRMALESTCTSNLKQLAAAAMLYEADHHGYMPRPFPRVGEDPAELWYNALASYSDVSTSGPIAQSLWTCPAQYRVRPQRFTYSENHQIQLASADGIFPNASQSTWNQERPVNRAMMLRPGKVESGRWPVGGATIPYFMDGWVWGDLSPEYASWRHLRIEGMLTTEALISRSHPHNRGCNIAFLDGHVEKMSFGEGIFKGASNPNFWPKYVDDELPF